MPPLTAPNSTSVGITRLGRPAATEVEELGPLAGLTGTWFGSHGFELIAVPTFANNQEGFRLIAKPYIEYISFVPIGAPAPDRGGPAGDLFITGLVYEMRIADAETNEPLHLETGMFFYLPGQEQEIARSATIPHGDSLLALGSASTTPGLPTFTPTTAIPDAGAQMPLGYLDVYQTVKGIDVNDVNSPLNEANQGLDFVSTTTLDLSTKPPGGILNIPFVTQNANATELSSVFWIETIKDATTGDEVLQLQYRQQTNICFLKKFDDSGDLIMWPHINVNTLRKQ